MTPSFQIRKQVAQIFIFFTFGSVFRARHAAQFSVSTTFHIGLPPWLLHFRQLSNASNAGNAARKSAYPLGRCYGIAPSAIKSNLMFWTIQRMAPRRECVLSNLSQRSKGYG